MDGDESSASERYGVSLVSGFYGKGSWTAWCLLVAATIVDKIFSVEQDTVDKSSHIYGLDINLVGSFAYPLIAAFDLALHMPHFFNNSAVQDGDIARIDAALVVVREGIVFGFFLLLACAFSTRKSQHRNPGLAVYFSGGCVLLFLTLNRVFDLGYCQFGWPSYVDGWVMMPYHLLFDTPQSTLAAKYPAFAQSFRNPKKKKNGHNGPPFWSVGLFIHTNLTVEILFKVMIVRFDQLQFLAGVIWAVAQTCLPAKGTGLHAEVKKKVEHYGIAEPVAVNDESSRALTESRTDIELGEMERNARAEEEAWPTRPRRPTVFESNLPQHRRQSWAFEIDSGRSLLPGHQSIGPTLGISRDPVVPTIREAGILIHMIFRGTIVWQAVRALADITLNFALMVSHVPWMVPITETRFTDLDQMGALITAGVLPLVYSVGSALCERWEIMEIIQNNGCYAVVAPVKDPSRNF